MSPRKELLLVGAFAALNVLVPLCVLELYPFSIGPMFRDAPRRYTEYSAVGPDGTPVPLVELGLHRRYNGNPPWGTGFLHRPTIDNFDGDPPPMPEVAAWVRERLAGRPEASVTVTRRVIADLGDGTVGPVAEESVRVDNPKKAAP